MLQKLHEKNGSTSEKEEWRRLEGKNPTKWHWEKGSWRWGLAKIEALQNGSGIFICFIKSWMHWFDHFLTKLSKYLWIKTGDRHYHFVEPWVIDRPFCRMETVYQNHFVETGVGSLQNGAPQPPQGMGRRIAMWQFTRGYALCIVGRSEEMSLRPLDATCCGSHRSYALICQQIMPLPVL